MQDSTDTPAPLPIDAPPAADTAPPEGYGLKRRPKGRPASCSCDVCDKCKHRIYMKEYLKKPEQQARIKKYRAKDEVKALRRNWYKEHYNDGGVNQEHRRDYVNSYFLNRRAKDIHFKIACNLRSRLNSAIKKDVKGGSAVRDLGCSIPELKAYLAKKFLPGMTWENWTNDTWHIDHIIPLDAFDLRNPAQVREACNFTNLQPLWALENISKGNR